MQIGWIDFSAEDRSRTLTVLNALNEPGSVDELGIGIARDAVSNVLFPGTSTLLTKARYFFLVPYISRYLEIGHDSARQDPRALRNTFRDLERRCAEGLLKCCDSDEGIIGRVSLPRGKWVTRGPGEIYWASLHALGFMREGSPDSFFVQFPYLADARLRERSAGFDGDESGLVDDQRVLESMWHIPRECYVEWRNAWDNWGEEASIQLTAVEAKYLRGQIIASQPYSLYSLILQDSTLRDIALASLRKDSGDSSFHAFLMSGGLTRIQALAPELADLCMRADDFSELVLGCRIAYNMQLPGLEESGRAEWEAFAPRASAVAQKVDLPALGRLVGLEGHGGYLLMSAFLSRAIEAMKAGDLDALKLEVARRESAIKGARRKIGKKDLGEFAWRGGHRLPFRFTYAMSIVREIVEVGGCDA
ncbi:MAG: hypothetical protein IJI12_01830 [Atopobiaceae bacterium]|nr:hypothetical protein [Atopobiaceae bacterium]